MRSALLKEERNELAHAPLADLIRLRVILSSTSIGIIKDPQCLLFVDRRTAPVSVTIFCCRLQMWGGVIWQNKICIKRKTVHIRTSPWCLWYLVSSWPWLHGSMVCAQWRPGTLRPSFECMLLPECPRRGAVACLLEPMPFAFSVVSLLLK